MGQHQENTVVGKYTEYEQLQMSVVENKMRLEVLQDELEDKKLLVLGLGEKRQCKEDDLVELQQRVTDFTDATDEEVATQLVAIDEANVQSDEYRAEIEQIRTRMGTQLPQSPERPERPIHFHAQTQAAAFGY